MTISRETFFDVIVIGGGHAGCEAAAAAARMGVKVALVTFSKDDIGVLSCNPSIGGVAKGCIVKELAAMGGVMPKAADRSCIHFNMLNNSKGPAVWGPRAQVDRDLYKSAVNQILAGYLNLSVIEGEVVELLEDRLKVCGLLLASGEVLYASAVVLSTGTFLGGNIHMGSESWSAGRFGGASSNKLSSFFREKGFSLSRLKTGTPPRILKDSIRYDLLQEQKGMIPSNFADYEGVLFPPQISCHIAYTNLKIHELIKANLHNSPMYTGGITGVGPRYCPSIEDKVVRFAGKNQHRIFLEPEGLHSDIVYPNGISTSLPKNVQLEIVRSIEGLENAEIVQYGYAVEYSFFDPRDLYSSLESKKIQSLFFAGQINGTTGYEEAAGQGIIAGINAALKVKGEKEYIHLRSDSYIGVMINDLIAHGVSEPYRLMTARAEYRLHLRSDTAFYRLAEKARLIGVLGDEDYKKFIVESDLAADLFSDMSRISFTSAELLKLGIQISQDGKRRSLYDLAAIPFMNASDLIVLAPKLSIYPEKVLHKVFNDAKYKIFEDKIKLEIDFLHSNFELKLPFDIDYFAVAGLSSEMKDKLSRFRPNNFAELKSLQGITPAAIIAVQRYLKMHA